MNRKLAVLLLTFVAIASSLALAADKPVVVGGQPMYPTKDIIDNAVNSADHTTLVAAVKIVAEIERSADLAVNICKASRRLYGHEFDPRLRGLITRMSDQAQMLYTAAIDAFVQGDAASSLSGSCGRACPTTTTAGSRSARR